MTRPPKAKGRVYRAARHPCLTYKHVPKRAYLDEVEAKEAAERINSYRSTDGHVFPYVCRSCQQFHLGHLLRDPKEHRRQREANDRFLRSDVFPLEVGDRAANCLVTENMKGIRKGEFYVRKLARIGQDGIRLRA